MDTRSIIGAAGLAALAALAMASSGACQPAVDGFARDEALAGRRAAARQAAIAREALAVAGAARLPPPKPADQSLADWAIKWLNVTEGVPAGATDNAFLFIEGRPPGRTYPAILVDVRAEYAAPQTAPGEPPYRSQFYRLAMDCAASTVRLTTVASFSGNALQGDIRFEPDGPAEVTRIIPKSAMWMIETQACPMALGQPPPGFRGLAP